jgi:DNA-directed RNA polymerase omega subunit
VTGRISIVAGNDSRTETMEKLLKAIGNRYEAIRVMAKEARRINTLIRISPEDVEEKPTTIAMNRVIEGKVKYEYEEPEEE